MAVASAGYEGDIAHLKETTMKKLTIAMAATLALLAATPGIAKAPDRDYASIPFVGFGGIRNWTATDDDTGYLQASNNQWYEAELAGPCMGLPLAFVAVTFATVVPEAVGVPVMRPEALIDSPIAGRPVAVKLVAPVATTW